MPPNPPRPPHPPLFIDPEDKLKSALRGLGADQLEARRCISEMVTWLNEAVTADALLEEVARYPLHERELPGGGGPLPKFPPKTSARRVATAILAAREALGGRFHDVLQVAAVAGVDEVVLAQLIHVGCQHAHRHPPGPIIGVLLPIRIETRFFAHAAGAGADWIVRVRVIPDAASLDRHLPIPTNEELDALETMWVNANADLTTDEGKAQWRRFAAQVGAARAAWLARTFPAQVTVGQITINRPAGTRTDLGVSRVAGLPDNIEIWIARGGAPATRVQTLAVDHAKLALDFPDPATNETRWWMSFEEAKTVGLGTEIPLGPTRPDDIDALYVVGIGDDDPVTLFSDHRDAGVLGVLAPATPTNSVAGVPAADLARDPETWRTLLVAPPGQPGAEAVSLALTGRPDAITPLPGGDFHDGPVNSAMVSALWSVLWGHALKDVWGLGGRAFELGQWAAASLVPEGAIPTVRVGDQPYGVLPATSLSRWTAAAGDAAIEAHLAPALAALRHRAAAAAEAAGTAVGADTGKLLELIGRVPLSRGYAWRWMLPLENVHAITWGVDGGVQWAKLAGWWDDLATGPLGLGATVQRRYSTIGYPQDLNLPLVEPDNLPPGMTFKDAILRIVSTSPTQLATAGGLRELFRELPNSLLLRLLIHSMVVNAAEVARAAKHATGPLLDPVLVPNATPTEVTRWATQFSVSMVGGDPVSDIYRLARHGAIELAGVPIPALERVFRATLDTAMYRIDPWVIGLAWRRLQTLSAARTPPRFRLGVYGWVDAPGPRTTPAFPDEYLHAPSEPQALTAAVLRDRALFDAEPARWQIDLDSDSVRAADALAAEVRVGSHIAEAVGRAVERAVATRASVEALRAQFPIRAEHKGRRVCDGLAVLRRYATNPASLGLSAAQLAALAPITEAVDSYGDLLVADAVHDVVSGRAALAGAAMEAAAGLGAPPDLDVIRTQRSGRTVTTSVFVTLPDGTPPAALDDHTSPGRTGEPSVADALIAFTGEAASEAWTWHVLDENETVITTVTLADIRLEPIDTLSMSPIDLHTLVLDHTPGNSVNPPVLPAHQRGRRLSDILGSQPATPADLVVDASNPPATAVHDEILARYTDVVTVATNLRNALVAAQSADEATMRAALRDAAKWGITPMRADRAPLPTLVSRALAALAERVGKAPSPADAASLSVVNLAAALAQLVSPEGRLPVLARIPLDQLPALAAEPPANGEPLDPNWLEVVATVRTPLARLEAFQRERQLDGADPLAAWTNRPGDPWQVAPTGPPAPNGLQPTTRLLAVFGPAGTLTPGADAGRTVAIALLDSWGEVIPGTDHTTTTAFHFDAPGSRAPQAILVAVPPDPARPLDTGTLVDIVRETRELARARAAAIDDLGDWATAIPLTLFPYAPPSGVGLDRA